MRLQAEAKAKSNATNESKRATSITMRPALPKEPALENAEKKSVDEQNHNARDKRMKEVRLYQQI